MELECENTTNIHYLRAFTVAASKDHFRKHSFSLAVADGPKTIDSLCRRGTTAVDELFKRFRHAFPRSQHGEVVCDSADRVFFLFGVVFGTD